MSTADKYICGCLVGLESKTGYRCECLAWEVIEHSLSKRKSLAAQLGHRRRDDQHHLWLLPSPARARRACPLPGQGEGSDGTKKSRTLCEFRAQNPAGRQPAGILREARGE